MTLHGVIPAIITPMKDDGSLDEDALAVQTAYLSEAGVDGFFVGGTTAEGSHLTTREIRRSFEIVMDVSAGRQFLCLASILGFNGRANLGQGAIFKKAVLDAQVLHVSPIHQLALYVGVKLAQQPQFAVLFRDVALFHCRQFDVQILFH